MLRNYMLKILYNFLGLIYFLNKKLLGGKSSLSIGIVKLNNFFIMKRIANSKIEKVLLILPHCVQSPDCKIRVTNSVENCVSCGKCKIGEIKKSLHRDFNVEIKIASGGTVARQCIKEEKPTFVIAVACERDLISGIVDAAPFPVYGIFNRIVGKQCCGTDFSVEEINKLITDISSNREGK